MAVQKKLEQYMTVDEWRELERTSEIKHEYRDGRIYAMSGGTGAHSGISGRAFTALDNALADRPCKVYNADMAIKISASSYVYPDASVSCGERDQATDNNIEVETPLVVVEVLSNSTEADNRGEKFMYYQACPTIQEYVMINTKFQRVEVYRRAPGKWPCHIYGPGEEVYLMSLDIHFSVDFLYRKTNVPLLPNSPKGKRRLIREESI